jgi:hypothetical protein
MKLRDHPLVEWPPKFADIADEGQIRAARKHFPKFLREAVLVEIERYTPQWLVLVCEYRTRRYVSSLWLREQGCADKFHRVLQGQVRRTFEQIGNLEIAL